MSRTRTRRIAKWTGLGLSVLIVASWLLTLYGLAIYCTNDGVVCLGGGGLSWQVRTANMMVRDGWTVERYTYSPPLWLPINYVSGPVFLPLWIPLLAIAIPTIILWRRDRRHPPGHCRKCGYDLTGNVTGVCSECEEPTSTEKTK